MDKILNKKYHRFTELTIIRFSLERQGCTDPTPWQALAEDFAAIGAPSNAEKCARLAAHFSALAQQASA